MTDGGGVPEDGKHQKNRTLTDIRLHHHPLALPRLPPTYRVPETSWISCFKVLWLIEFLLQSLYHSDFKEENWLFDLQNRKIYHVHPKLRQKAPRMSRFGPNMKKMNFIKNDHTWPSDHFSQNSKIRYWNFSQKMPKNGFWKRIWTFFCNFCNSFFIMKTWSPGSNFYMSMFARL